jgi:GTP-binding protein Era
MDSRFLSGFIAIAGPPNVGKSTLLNRLLGTKVAIVSPKPQTTRNRILGIYHGDGFQMVFMDTPGIHRTKTHLHKSMVTSAQAALTEVDVIAVMIEMTRPDDPDIPMILRKVKEAGKPCYLLINKIDRGPREGVLPIMEAYRKRYPFEAIVPISALTGDGTDGLLRELRSQLRPGPAFFPAHMKTDQTESFLVGEIIREKIFLRTRRELPYSSAVSVEKIAENSERGLLSISARIHVESDSQKAILIGRRGEMIKTIGRASRLEIEKIFGIHTFLDLTVRVEKNWSKDPKALRRLGY